MKIAVISDIHSNLEALSAVLGALPAVDEIWCLGDIVGYAAEPAECINALMGQPVPVTSIAGNHDMAATGNLGLDLFNNEGRTAVLWTQPLLSESLRAWLPLDPKIELTDRHATLVHASPRDPVWEYITSDDVAESCFPSLTTPLCFFGHTHVPIVFATKDDQPAQWLKPPIGTNVLLRRLGQRQLVNPGSVGQPSDGDPRASFLIFNLEEMSVSWHRVEYDIAATQAKIKKAGLPTVLADRLAYGR